MATPWLDPSTVVPNLSRRTPAPLCPSFDGRTLFKQSLFTKDVARAVVLFVAANADLERRFEEARLRLPETANSIPTDRNRADELVHAYFNGPATNDGKARGEQSAPKALVRYKCDW